MSLYFALRDLDKNLPQISEAVKTSIEPGLLKMVKMGGTFPTSLRLIELIRGYVIADRATPEKAARLVASDPILSLRLISLVNQTFYSRGHDIITLQGAVNHLGLMKLAEICADLSESKNWRALFLGRAVSSLAMQDMLLNSILARRIVNLMAPREGLDEFAGVVSFLGRMGPTLLAFFKPNVYSACCLDALHSDSTNQDKIFKKLIGKSVSDFGAEVARTLALPAKLVNTAALVHIAPWHKRVWAADEGRDVRLTVGSVHIAQRITAAISDVTGPHYLDGLIEDLASRVNLKVDALQEIVGESLAAMVENLNNLGLPAQRLPAYVEKYTEPIVERDGTINSRSIKWPGIAERINSFLNELRACFKTRAQGDEFHYLPQAVMCTLRALVHGLNFDFACFLRYSVASGELTTAAWLGENQPGLTGLARKRGEPGEQYMPDIQALLHKKTTFSGDPIFEHNWPFAAFPAISRNDVIGIFYAHKRGVSDPAPLDTQEQVAVIALAEEWHEMPAGFF